RPPRRGLEPEAPAAFPVARRTSRPRRLLNVVSFPRMQNLRDKLLKAGLVTEKQAQEAAKQQRQDSPKKQREREKQVREEERQRGWRVRDRRTAPWWPARRRSASTKSIPRRSGSGTGPRSPSASPTWANERRSLAAPIADDRERKGDDRQRDGDGVAGAAGQ